MKLITVTLLISLTGLSSFASAGVWIWYLNAGREGPYFQVAADEDSALVLAREHHDSYDQSDPKLWATCSKKGYFALMSFFAPGDPIGIGKRFGGGCEQETREKAYSAAIRSCEDKPECKAALTDKSWAFNLQSFQDDEGVIKNWKECTYFVTSENHCSGDGAGYDVAPFDLDDFLKDYDEASN